MEDNCFQVLLVSALQVQISSKHIYKWASQVVLVVKNQPVNAGDLRDASSIPGWGRVPGGGHSNPLQYSCLENPMDRGAWWATVHRVTKSCAGLKRLSMYACNIYILSFLSLPPAPHSLSQSLVLYLTWFHFHLQSFYLDFSVVEFFHLNLSYLARFHFG